MVQEFFGRTDPFFSRPVYCVRPMSLSRIIPDHTVVDACNRTHRVPVLRHEDEALHGGAAGIVRLERRVAELARVVLREDGTGVVVVLPGEGRGGDEGQKGSGGEHLANSIV